MTTSALPYDHPARLGLRQLVAGDAEAALESARGYLRQHHLQTLPAPALPGVVAGLKRKVVKVMREVGLLVALEGGAAYEVRDLGAVDQAALEQLLAGRRAGSSSGAPSAATLRQRRRRERLRQGATSERDIAPVTPAVTPSCHAVTPHPVTPVTTTDVTPVTPTVTAPPEAPVTEETPAFPLEEPVTSERDSGLAYACGENSPSLPLSNSKKEEGEEREPSSVTAPRASSPPAPLPAPQADPAPELVALWSEVIGRPQAELQPRDLVALQARQAEGHSLRAFRAAFAHAASEAWFCEKADRQRPHLVCSEKYWAECVRKGSRLLPREVQTPPSSRPGPVSAGPQPLRPELPPGAPELPADWFDRPGLRADRDEPRRYRGHLYLFDQRLGVWVNQSAPAARTA